MTLDARSIILKMPQAFSEVDGSSLRAQREFLMSTRIQLLLLVAAGSAGAVAWTSGSLDLAALLGGVAFAAAALLRLILLRRRPHRRWYDGRAAAESIKTLSWRYSVGGQPFPLVVDEPRQRFAAQVEEVLSGLRGLPPSVGDAARTPTTTMDELRDADLLERQRAYASERIEDQRRWYAMKAESNRRRARAWSLAIVALQAVAAFGAFLKGFGVVDIDLFGVAAAVVASCAAWLETKQHAALASAYQVTHDEVARIASLAAADRTESEWAGFVSESEAAFSREHTMWKASSTQRAPVGLA